MQVHLWLEAANRPLTSPNFLFHHKTNENQESVGNSPQKAGCSCISYFQIILIHLQSQIRFLIGGEHVTCRGSKLTNSLGKQLELSTHTWSGRAPWNYSKIVCQPASSKRFFRSFSFYFWVGRYNKTLNDWPHGKQWVLFPLDIEGVRETKLTVALGASH